MRLGLCCLFVQEKITFKSTVAKALLGLSPRDRLRKLSGICLHNAQNLVEALKAVHRLGIGAFRISSQLFPRMTHPVVGYDIEQLDDAEHILGLQESTRLFAMQNNIRLSFHPDQFVLLSSPSPEVTANSLAELRCQAAWAVAVGADVINIHAGGVYGDKRAALDRLVEEFANLPEEVSSRLTLENDDISYTVKDLLPVCAKTGIPLVYDIHHHRCNPDGLSEVDATKLAGETWDASGREQYCHISSPRNGWRNGDPKPHADYINPGDFPPFWLDMPMTVDVEAKAKELAILQLMHELSLDNPSHP